MILSLSLALSLSLSLSLVSWGIHSYRQLYLGNYLGYISPQLTLTGSHARYSSRPAFLKERAAHINRVWATMW